jgi:hypothetical protein
MYVYSHLKSKKDHSFSLKEKLAKKHKVEQEKHEKKSEKEENTVVRRGIAIAKWSTCLAMWQQIIFHCKRETRR